MASSHSRPGTARNRTGPQLRAALRLLVRGWEYASQSQRDLWQYAVEIAELRAAGLTAVDLRWLLSKRYVQHAVEETKPGDQERLFGRQGDLQFDDRSCFVLTESGAAYARRIEEAAVAEVGQVPYYDRDRGQLWLGSVLVKRFKQEAPEQQTILSSFQELGWPGRIDDPLPKRHGRDPKQHLREVVKRLSRHQEQPLIRFRTDGRGQGIRWETVAGQ